MSMDKKILTNLAGSIARQYPEPDSLARDRKAHSVLGTSTLGAQERERLLANLHQAALDFESRDSKTKLLRFKGDKPREKMMGQGVEIALERLDLAVLAIAVARRDKAVTAETVVRDLGALTSLPSAYPNSILGGARKSERRLALVAG